MPAGSHVGVAVTVLVLVRVGTTVGTAVLLGGSVLVSVGWGVATVAPDRVVGTAVGSAVGVWTMAVV